MKKWFGIALILVLLTICILPTKAEAATSGYYTYTVSNGEATITACSTSISGDITIPPTLGGYPVTHIGASAFRNCSSLTSVTIPDSVCSIGSGAFSGCRSLVHMTLPFVGNKRVTSASGGEKYPLGYIFGYDSYSGGQSITQYFVGYGTTIYRGKYYLPNTLRSVTITGGDIPYGAFYDCNILTSVTLLQNVTNIDDCAFYRCTGLTEICIPNSVASIGEDAFFQCTGLRKAVLSSGIESIGDGAFGYCSGLREVDIPEGVTSIGADAFTDCSGLQEIVIPEGVISIGADAFERCTKLKHIALPSTLMSVGSKAFAYCSHLTQVCYGGTTEQRKNISILNANYNTALTSATWVCNAENVEIQTSETCTEVKHVCSYCQRTVWKETKSSSTHSWTEATCTTAKTCTVCGATEGEVPGHSGDQWFKIIAPTCTAEGMKARICTVCNETETQPVAALGHSYSAVVTAPTCTEQGYTTNTCSVCGDVTVTDYVDATGHSFGAWEQTTAPGCVTEGEEKRNCACGEIETQIVPAKGHSWSAWIQTAAPTCSTEGSRLRFCNCGTRETEAIAKLPHSLENYICTVCGELDYANTVLTGDVQADWNLTRDLYVDLAGFDLTGTIITNGYKVYGMDSTTDSYTCENIGYFTCVDENGSFIVPERIYTEGEKQYMAICTEDRYSFHRFFVGVTHMSLEPEVVGLGYKAAVFGDEMVFAELAETKAFSFRVQLEGYNPVYRHFGSSELASGDPITLRIRNYDVENYSEHNLYAQVSLTLSDGTVIEAEEVALTFRWLTEQVNANYTDYTNDQITQFKAMLQQFDIVKKWDIPNLI